MTYRNPLLNRDGDHIGKIVLYRMIFAIALVFVSWNPSGYSYTHWFIAEAGNRSEWMWIIFAVCGVLLAAFYFIAVYYSFKRLSNRAFIGGAILVLLAFLLVQWIGKWDVRDAGQVLAWLALLGTAILFGLGLSGRELNNFYDRLRPRRSHR